MGNEETYDTAYKIVFDKNNQRRRGGVLLLAIKKCSGNHEREGHKWAREKHVGVAF